MIIRAFLSDNTGGNVISRITRGKNTTESPNTVGTDQKKNSPPPFMAFTKNKISSRAPTPHKIHFISRFWEEISGTTVSAATSIMEAVTTENTPSPLPPAMDTIKVIRIGTSSRAAMTIPALYARFRSFLACRSRISRDSVSITLSMV